ncbi:MAG TPA: hypothetical protein VIC57_06105 [Candidatus Dormibacteraeota bacterium]|jgi:hypothetical protein
MAVVGVSGGRARWPRTSEIEWLSAEELLQRGYERSRVVMINEAISGLVRNARARRTGLRLLPVAWACGARLLAMEAMGPPGGAPPLPGVLEQPEMADLLAAARRLGFRLSGYDADASAIPLQLRTKTKSPAYSNWRDDQQAVNLANLLRELSPDDGMLVWAGNLHHTKVRFMAYQPTGWRFRARTGIDPFVIDQAATVRFVERRGSSPILRWAQDELQRRGGEAGFIWRQGLPRLTPGSDAWLLSLDNRME